MERKANKIFLFGGLASSLLNFRGALIRSFIKDYGAEVSTLSAPASDEVVRELSDMGVRHYSVPMARNGLNPLTDLRMIRDVFSLLRAEAPDILFAYTIKPVIYGGIAARYTKTPVYALISGLGFAFQGSSLRRRMLTKLVSLLYRWALSGAKKVIFQNPDNLIVFVEKGIVSRDKCVLVGGSGVNTSDFDYTPIPPLNGDGKLTFLCIARILGDKGLREYSKAAELVKQCYPGAEFCLLGGIDPSPDGIPQEEMASWNAINYLGESSDVRPYIRSSHVYVLPSYHEGLPRSSLEAMSMGRPILTTNAVGCKETVVDGHNGFKVDVGDANQLASKMIWCIENENRLQSMGANSRQMVQEKFDVELVNKQIFEAMGLAR